VNWHVYIQTSLEVGSLTLKLLVYWREFC